MGTAARAASVTHPCEMETVFTDAAEGDRDAITALHVGAADRLRRDFGQGPWARPLILRRLDTAVGRARVRVGRRDGTIVCALRLQRKKPWSIDVTYFTPVAHPLYLVDMVVGAMFQRRGIGRAALADALEVARDWPADAIRLDAWAAPAGAGPFYERCHYERRGQASYRGVPLMYFERLIASPRAL